MESKMTTILADCNDLFGHLKSGHYELELDSEQLEKFKAMSSEEKSEYIRDCGYFVLDDYSIDHKGDPENITIIDV